MTPLFTRCERNNKSKIKKKELTSIIHQPKIVSITTSTCGNYSVSTPCPVRSHYTEHVTKKKEKPSTFAGRHKNVYYKSNDQRSGNVTYPSFSKDTSSKQHRDIRNKQHGNPIQVPLNVWHTTFAGVNGCLIRALLESFGFHRPWEPLWSHAFALARCTRR